jgi:hypothetical protein
MKTARAQLNLDICFDLDVHKLQLPITIRVSDVVVLDFDDPLLPAAHLSWLPDISPIPAGNWTFTAPRLRTGNSRQPYKCSYLGRYPEEKIPSWKILSDVVIHSRFGPLFSSRFLYWPCSSIVQGDLPRSRSITVTEFCDEAICIIHRYFHAYFHILCETFPLIAAIPRHLIRRSVAYVPDPDLIKDLFNLIDCQPRKVIALSQSVFVRSLYIGRSSAFLVMPPRHVWALQHVVFERLKLNNAKPQFILSVQRMSSRVAVNEREFVNKAKVRFPREKWQKFIKSGSILSQVLVWAAAKVAIGVRGSAFSNVIWMKPNTAVSIVEVKFCDVPFVSTAVTMGLRVFASFSLWATVERRVLYDVPLLLDLLDQALKFTQEHGF